jgi:hypothetical protein
MVWVMDQPPTTSKEVIELMKPIFKEADEHTRKYHEYWDKRKKEEAKKKSQPKQNWRNTDHGNDDGYYN